MKDYSLSLTNTNGSAFPNTAAVNASSPTATDGTEYVKVLLDDFIGFNQGLMQEAGLTPNGNDETATASQRVEAIRFLIQNKAWNAFYNGTNWIYIANGKAFRWVIDDVNERVRFDYAVSGLAGNTITWINGPYIDANGYVGSVKQPFLHVQDQKASGTNGGTFTSGAWRTRTLNTVVTNTITGASLGSNQITLPDGDYYVKATAPAYQAAKHKTKLYNTTGAIDEIIGTSEYTGPAAGYAQTMSFLSGNFTVSGGPKVYELQHRCTTSKATDGLGVNSGVGVVEVYSDVKIWKIG